MVNIKNIWNHHLDIFTRVIHMMLQSSATLPGDTAGNAVVHGVLPSYPNQRSHQNYPCRRRQSAAASAPVPVVFWWSSAWWCDASWCTQSSFQDEWVCPDPEKQKDGSETCSTRGGVFPPINIHLIFICHYWEVRQPKVWLPCNFSPLLFPVLFWITLPCSR